MTSAGARPGPERPLRVIITCFPTYGGSGIVATEIGLGLARRGHEVHFVSAGVPVRLDRAADRVYLHEVTTGEHATLQDTGTYPLALASKLIEVAQFARIDLMHVHYAVPHATAAWMAREVLGPAAPRLITTLHGTDITLVAADPSFLPITRFSIERSDAVTTPSAFLRQATLERLAPSRIGAPASGIAVRDGGAAASAGPQIEVIPNFVDTERFAPGLGRDDQRLRTLFPDLEARDTVLCHASNFRPVKRLDDVVAIFAAVAAVRPARLLLVGDGPERSRVEARLRALGLRDRAALVGRQESCADWLRAADLFVLPSETESFGLAALEALSCGVPVLASATGGLGEVVDAGRTGELLPVGDVAAFAAAAIALIDDPARRATMALAARQAAVARFGREPAIDRYLALYARVLTSSRT